MNFVEKQQLHRKVYGNTVNVLSCNRLKGLCVFGWLGWRWWLGGEEFTEMKIWSFPFFKDVEERINFVHIIDLFEAKNQSKNWPNYSTQPVFSRRKVGKFLNSKKKSYFSKLEYFSEDVFKTLKWEPKILRKTVE